MNVKARLQHGVQKVRDYITMRRVLLDMIMYPPPIPDPKGKSTHPIVKGHHDEARGHRDFQVIDSFHHIALGSTGFMEIQTEDGDLTIAYERSITPLPFNLAQGPENRWEYHVAFAIRNPKDTPNLTGIETARNRIVLGQFVTVHDAVAQFHPGVAYQAFRDHVRRTPHLHDLPWWDKAQAKFFRILRKLVEAQEEERFLFSLGYEKHPGHWEMRAHGRLIHLFQYQDWEWAILDPNLTRLTSGKARTPQEAHQAIERALSMIPTY